MIDVIVVGFGFSAIPLLREMEATGTNYQVIADMGNTVWDGLSERNRLDFDLVSSYLTSYYSFDLAENFDGDYYPRASEFYAMHKKWQKVYGSKVIRDVVTRVDNFADRSVVHTRSGGKINARHVVFATGFGRAILNDLAHADYDTPNRTFLFDTMGDSANLMISHLIPTNAKIIVRTNGFHPRDKVLPAFGTTHTLDQLEFHNFRYVSHSLYGAIVYGATRDRENPILIGDQFPVSVRDESWNSSKSHPVSGAVAIKYWPIDEYSRKFGSNLAEAIERGYLLNDVSMWLHTGRVIVAPKDTPVDFEKQTITYAGTERHFDRYVKGDVETPRLPPILIEGTTPYEYVYRDNFMGVIPKALRNIYMLGFTRPYTGGLANIVEMQGLLVHKLVTQPEFHGRIHRNLSERITSYNEHYYGKSSARPFDHLVYYGFYTDDVARLIGIDLKPEDCKSIQDLMFYYAFPNNTFKYRLSGEYKVDGVDGLIEKVNHQFKDFIVSFAYLMRCSRQDEATRPAWLHQASRHFFNDMRHKERYKPFLNNYIRAYRRVKGIQVSDSEDPQWDAMVAHACRERDQALGRIQIPSRYQMDEDMAAEIALIESWMNGGREPVMPENLKLSAAHASCIDALMHPPEYPLPFLQ